jgi:23S rRNA pseudouridine2605 synthase
MSKPPSKSGGSGRGRPPRGSSGGGSSRDGASFGGSPRGGPSRGSGQGGGSGPSRDGAYRSGPARDGAPRGDRPRYDKPREGSGYRSGPARDGARDSAPRGDSQRDDKPREGSFRSGRDGAPRGDRPRDDKPREGGFRSGRDGAPRGDRSRYDTPRDGGGRGGRDGAPRGERPRGDKPREGGYRSGPARDGAPRGERSRDDKPREGGYRSGPARDGAPRGERPRDDRAREDKPREGGFRTASPQGGYRSNRDDRPRSDDRYGAGRGRGEAPRGPRPVTRPGPAPRAAAPTPKDPTLPAREGERIAKLLARAGVASRREVERIIIEGRVKLGDQVIETPSTVLTSLRGVTVDGNPVRDAEGTRLFLFHKPAGLITAERDPAGRPTIYDALRNSLPEGAGRVMPVGRLDLSTEGLLLLTNDGEFKRQLELPSTGVPRTYRARTFGDITQSRLEELMEGIEVDGVIYGKINANMERRTGRNQWIEMTLTEGKNREVRRVLEALDLQVSRLIRVAYGPFLLGDLPKGASGEISQRDLENFRRTLPAEVRPAAGEADVHNDTEQRHSETEAPDGDTGAEESEA